MAGIGDDEQWVALAGFSVEAPEGEIGKVQAAEVEYETTYLVVDVEALPSREQIIVPASFVELINLEERTISINLTRDEIMDAPDVEEADLVSPDYRDQLASYYGGLPGRPTTPRPRPPRPATTEEGRQFPGRGPNSDPGGPIL
jgi:hypothetical protein